ncbi:MAG: hypothetical protein WC553_01375 [Patescibacteria group bacterium]
MNNRHWLVEFFRWDIRAVLAAVLGLAILVGVTWAATATTLLVSFDFGGASLSDKAPNMVQVKGGLSMYPQTSGNYKFGWVTAGINEFSNKTVSDLMKRDSNSGPTGAIFRISGLEQGIYAFKATVGSADTKLSTRMRVGSLATGTTTIADSWQVMTLTAQIDTGTADLVFSSFNGSDAWGICGLSVYDTVGTISTAGFSVTATPSSQPIKAGNTAVFRIGVTPSNNYASKVTAQVSGLVGGMTANFMPAQLGDLPGEMELNIYTADTVPTTSYNLVVTVVGDDVSAVQDSVTITLTVTSGATVGPDSGNSTIGGNSTTGGTNEVPSLSLRTPTEVKADFVKVDDFVAEQQAKALKKNNFAELKDISDALSSVPVYEDLPQAQTTTEAILQKLVKTGIIGSTSESAPQVDQTPAPPLGFWQNLIKSIFKPAQ